jgi:hypothetical protein
MNPYDELAEELPQAPSPVTAPPKPRAPNPYDALAQNPVEDPVAALMRAQRQKALEQSRDARVKAQQIGKTLGLPVGLIHDQDVPGLEKQAQHALVPDERIAKDSPALAAWLAGEPDAASLAAGDLYRLGAWEWFKTMPLKAWDIGMAQRRIAYLQAEKVRRPNHKLTDAEQQALLWDKNWIATNSDLDIGKSWWRDHLTGNIGVLPGIFSGITNAAYRGGTGTVLGYGLGAAAGGLATRTPAGAHAFGMGVARISGRYSARLGFAEDIYEQEMGSALDEYEDITDEQGRKIDPDAAMGAAMAAGFGNALLENVEVGVFLKAFKKVSPDLAKQVAKYGAKKVVREALRNRTVRAAFAHAFKTYMKTYGKEISIEGLQRMWTVMTANPALEMSGMEPRSYTEIAQEGVKEVAGAASSLSLIVGLPASVQLARGIKEAGKAPDIQQFFKAYGALAKDSTTVRDAPEAAARFLKMAGGEHMSAVYAPTDLWDEFWQSQEKDPDEMADQLLGEEGALEKAKANGTDLVIPIETYGTKLAPTEWNDGLSEILRVHPRGSNAIEERAFIEARKALAERENLEPEPGEAGAPVEGAAPTEAPGEAPTPGVPLTPEQRQSRLAQFVGELQQQLTLTRRYTASEARKLARYLAAPIGQLALDMGMDPYDAAAKYGLEIRTSVDPRIQAQPRQAPATGTPTATVAPEAGTPQPLTAEGQLPQDETQNAIRQGEAAPAAGTAPETAPGTAPAVPALTRGPDETDADFARRQDLAAIEESLAAEQRSLDQALDAERALFAVLDPEQAEQDLAEEIGEDRAREVQEAFDRAVKLLDAAEGHGDGLDVPTSLEAWLASDAAAEVLDPDLLQAAREALGLALEPEAPTDEELSQAEKTAAAGPKPKKPAKKAVPLNLTNLLVAPIKWVGEALHISTRVPDGPKAQPATEPLVTTLPVLMDADPVGIKRFADKVREQDTLTKEEKANPDDKAVIETFIERSVDNLRWLWGLFPDDIRERAQEWYVGGHRLAQRLKARHNLTISQAAALIAVLSPQMDWFKNMNLAFRLADIYALMEETNPVFDTAYFDSYANRVRTAKVEKRRRTPELYAKREKAIEYVRQKYVGRKWSEIDVGGQAIMLRDYDEQHNARWHHVITPEGDFHDFVQTDPDKQGRRKKVKVGWGPYKAIANGIQILKDPSARNIHARLGGKHKVRSFYMNILDPSHPEVVTIDTHASAAVVLQPLSGSDGFVKRVLSQPPGIKDKGLMGLNVIVAEAYFRLARRISAERAAEGLPPVIGREVQSVTWEVIRLLFPAVEKRIKDKNEKVLLKKVAAIWSDFSSGTIDLHEARRQILGTVKTEGGIRRPAWADAGRGVAPDEGELPGGIHYGAGARLPARRGNTGRDPRGIGGVGAEEPGGVLGGMGLDPNAPEADDGLALLDTDTEEYDQPASPPAKGQQALRLFRNDNQAGPEAQRLIRALLDAGVRLPLDQTQAAQVIYLLLDKLHQNPDITPAQFAHAAEQLGLDMGLRQPAGRNLIIQHNTTAKKLRQVLRRLGGFFAVPSLAITGAEQAVTGFGDITLLGDRELADPSRGARVFGADIYSPRYPSVTTTVSARKVKTVLDPLIAKWGMQTEDYVAIEDLEEQGIAALHEVGALHLEFLEQHGITPLPARMQLSQAGIPYPDANLSQAQWMQQIREAGLESAYVAYVQDIWDSLQPKEKIDRGVTRTGNRRRGKPHTLENVVTMMRRNLRGGEHAQNIYGMGHVRARVTPQFRSLAAIKRAAGERIVTKEVMRDYQRQVELALRDLVEMLQPYAEYGPLSNQGAMELLYDVPRMGLTRALWYHSFKSVPADVQSEIGDLLTGLKDLPTEYFETKHMRAVGLSEFTAAVVPDNVEPEIRTALEAAGLEVRTYPRQDQKARQDTVATTASELDVMFQPEGQRPGAPAGRRGSYRRDRTTGQVTLNLFTAADPSTALHEGAHWFMRVLHDMAQTALAIPEAERTDGHKRVIANYNAALQTLGARTFADLTEEQHERWADQFVAYLMTGKAPSRQHRDLFITFRSWLMRVYENFTQLGGEVHPNLKKVFDRLLASDAEIAQAEADGNVRPLFTTAEDMGWTPERFAAYRAAGQDAHDEAVEQFDAQLMQDVAREQTEAWQAQRAVVQAEVAEDVHSRPVYRALAGIRRGTLPNGQSLTPGEAPTALPMNRAAVVALVGKDRARALPRGLMTTKPGEGDTPDNLALMFGFAGGDQMITALTEAAPMQAVIEEETDQRMLDEHGSLLMSSELAESAEQAVTNEKRQAVVEAELRAIAAKKREVSPFTAQARREERVKTRKAKAERDALAQELREARQERRAANARMRGSIPSRQAVLAAVRAQLAATMISKLRPDRYWAAMQKASRLAVEAANRGDWATAAHQKTIELVNIVLYREAVDAKKDIARREKAMKALAKTATQKILGKAGANFRSQINGFLARYNLAQVDPQSLEDRPAIGGWLAARAGEGDPVDELPWIMANDQAEMPYKDLTLEQFVDLTDGIAMLTKWARRTTLFSKLFDQADMIAHRDLLIVEGLANVPPSDKPPLIEYDDKAVRNRKIGLYFARLMKLAAIMRVLDAGKDDGLFWNTFVRPLNEADARARTRKAEAFRAFEKLMDLLPGGMLSLKEKSHVEGVATMSRDMRLSIAAYWGTRTGRDRLLNDPVRRFSQQQLELVIDSLDEQEWAYVNGMVAYVNSYWEDIANLQERVTGIRPQKVDAEPFMTRFGEQPGGYWHIDYDPRMGTMAQSHQTAETLDQLKKGAYLRSTTRQGHNEPRKKHVQAALKLEMSTGWTHIEQVIHDLTHREVLLDLNRLLRDTKFDAMLRSTIGAEWKDQIAEVMSAIAVGNGASHHGEEALAWMRTGAQISVLAFATWTAMQQPTGMINGMQRLGKTGPYWVAKGMGRWLSFNPMKMYETVQWVSDKSVVMRDRGVNMNEDVRQLRASLQQAGGWFDRAVRKITNDRWGRESILEAFMFPIALAQRIADMPVWLGAYEKYMADPQENRTAEEHDARAVALADQIIIDSQGSGSIKDLASVQRGGPAFNMWTMFYSYGSTTWNSAAVSYHVNDLTTVSGWAKFTTSLFGIYVAPSAVVLFMGHRVGKFKDEDWSEWFLHLAMESLGSALNGLIFVRELTNALKQAVTGEPVRNYQGPAAVKIFTASTRLIQQSAQGELDAAQLAALNDTLGVLLKWPSVAASNAVRGYVALEEGRSRNPFVLLLGPPPEER